MPQWMAMANSKFQLVFDPATSKEERIPFTISEADIEDAIDYGRVERHDPFDMQLRGAAYHKVMELNVADDERIFQSAWVVLCSGKIIAANIGAVGLSDDDME